MNSLYLAWLLGRRTSGRRGPLLLTITSYAVVTALVLTVVGGALAFRQLPADAQGTYLSLAALAVMLLIIPLLVLGRAAAQLSARSHDRALSSLRLMGATGGQVRWISVLQAVAAAMAGAVLGVGLYYLLAPLVGLIHFQGRALGNAVYASALVVVGVLLAVAVLSVISSLIGLRKLVITPLAVRRRTLTPKPRWVRALIALGVLVVLYNVFTYLDVIARDLATMLVILVLGMGMGLGVMNLVGPWLVAMVGRAKLRKAQDGAQLLAARMILESPQQAWRQVSGVAMAAFIAVVGGTGAAMMQLTGDTGSAGWEQYLGQDVLSGVLLTLAVSFICVAASSTITQAAATLDRADLYHGLNRLGMPYELMNRARVKSVMIPTLTAAIGFGLASLVLVFPLAGMALIMQPLTVLTVCVGATGAGLLLVRLAISVAAPQRLLSAGERGGIHALAE